jgi:beta-galactosidase
MYDRIMQSFILALVSLSLNASPAGSQTFAISDSQFLLRGKPFQIISGEMHYVRIPPEYWRDRLVKAKCMGLNTISTYVFWNVHEPRQGVFNFTGNADIARFVMTAQEVGLYVILRPGPYVCAEWDFGGCPSWLLKEHDLKVRSTDPRFLAACERYIKMLGRELTSLQISKGGPIIMVQIENEYGSFGNDTAYPGKIRDMIRGAGFDVPLFSADGSSQMPNAYLPDVFPGVNGATGQDIFNAIRRYKPHGPYFVPEFYPGWLDHWGEPHAKVDVTEIAGDLEWILSHDISVNLYMFHGGTNFGFMNGANFGYHYQPQPTSYDYDAPLDEEGRPTPKYFKLQEVIKKYLPADTVLPSLPSPLPLIDIPSFTLRETCDPFESSNASIFSDRPRPMEDLDQSYGYILYRHVFKMPVRGKLVMNDLHDYGIVCVNGEKIASLDRRNKQRVVPIDIPGAPATLDILVENGGRVNYGREMISDRKGITGSVTIDGKELFGWNIHLLPMENAPNVRYLERDNLTGPVVYRGKFILPKTGDTFLDMRGWGKGCVWVNGRNLGRFWYLGPQQTLYVPGAWLKSGENEITVLELEGSGYRNLRGLREPILDSLENDRLKPILPPRVKGKIHFSENDLVSEGNFLPGDKPRDIVFSLIRGRYICLRSISSQRNDHFASIAEFYLLDGKGEALDCDKWKIYTVDSEELQSEDGQAENIFDGNNETIWHTQWGSAQPDHPHYVVIDIGEDRQIGGFRYVPRQEDRPGKIKEFKFYVRHAPFEIDTNGQRK